MSSILNIGLGSLTAYQTALNAISQNIANVNTPFYSRKEVDFVEAIGGNGVNVGNIARIYDDASSQNLLNTTSLFSMADTLLNKLTILEPMLDDDTSNIAKYINDSLSALQQLNADPSSIQARNAYLSKLTNLTAQFNQVSSQVSSQESDCNQYVTSYIASANQALQNIASINQQIAITPEGNDLSLMFDNREQQVQALAQYFQFNTQTSPSGVISIYLSNGMELVHADQAVVLTTINDPVYPTNLDVTINNGSNNVSLNNYIQNGYVGAILSFRNTLMQTQTSLGRLALSLADQFNQQNKLGIDYNGNLGGDIFTDINTNTAINSRVINNLNNTGTGQMTVNITDSSQLQASDYQLAFTAGNNYVLTRLSDNSTISSGTLGSLPQIISGEGFAISFNTGTANAGDTFIISPTNNAASNMALAVNDPKLLALGFPVAVIPNNQNLGGGIASLTGVTDTSTSAFATPQQLSPPITIKFLSSTSYQLVNASNNTVIEGPITYNPVNGGNVFPTPGSYDPGYRVSLSGNISAGDSFNITFNSNSAGDNGNGLILSNMYQQGILEGGTLSFIQAYRDLSSDVSRQTNSAQIQWDSTNALNIQALNSFNEISAVNLQEETVNLASYQEAYQASAQIIQTAKNIFDTILGMLRS